MDATYRVVAGWILEERLGSGGFGEVWRARRRHVELFRALKLVPVSSESAFASWRHEISRLEALSHPNIVRFYDADIVNDHGPYEDFAWIATELCERSLADELRRRDRHVLTTPECTRLVEDMLAALAAAHGSGCVHRDIKPANILRHPAAGWKLCDFGTARLIPAGEDYLHTAVIGTFPYMSPAAHRGRQDQAADLYALGVTLHEALCGQRLHLRAPGMTDSEYVKLILDEPPTISTALDERWRTLVAALIGDLGPRSAAELLDQLHRTGGHVLAHPDGAPHAPALGPPAPEEPAPTLTAGPTRPPAPTVPRVRPRADATRRSPTRGARPTGGSGGPGAQQRTTTTHAEREHLVAILVLIVGSMSLAGLLLYQLVPNALAIGVLAGMVVLVLVLLILLS
jgi:serine/threonine-protein kinase